MKDSLKKLLVGVEELIGLVCFYYNLVLASVLGQCFFISRYRRAQFKRDVFSIESLHTPNQIYL